jgi:hypothetical protein
MTKLSLLHVVFLQILMFSAEGAQAVASSDVVEVQYNVCEPTSKAVKGLGLKAEQAVERQTYLFETDSFEIINSHYVIRLRVAEGEAELAVKKSALTQAEFNYWSQLGAECEYDVHFGNTENLLNGACKSEQTLTPDQLGAVLSGQVRVDDVFSDLQDKLFTTGSSSIGRVRMLGPLNDRVWKFKVAGFDKKISLEESLVTNGSSFLEISTRTTVGKIDAVSARLENLLAEKSIRLCTDQNGQRRKKLHELLQ